MTPITRQAATVVHLPLPKVEPKSTEAMLLHVQRFSAWRRNNPGATLDEELAEGARLSKELGL